MRIQRIVEWIAYTAPQPQCSVVLEAGVSTRPLVLDALLVRGDVSRCAVFFYRSLSRSGRTLLHWGSLCGRVCQIELSSQFARNVFVRSVGFKLVSWTIARYADALVLCWGIVVGIC